MGKLRTETDRKRRIQMKKMFRNLEREELRKQGVGTFYSGKRRGKGYTKPLGVNQKPALAPYPF